MEDKDREHKDLADPRQTLKPIGGRDELNLAEFPITLLSDRVPKGCKTITFEVEHRDSREGQMVSRKVTITGSDAYGLPTAVDDEILLALIQLTKLKNNFESPTVFFTRYEILKLLGWADDGRSYRRIEESIRRWTGVTLYYDNAWKDKETGTWASENFHFIERSTFLDAEARRVRKAQNQHELALSSFKWNEVIFQSFQAGSLKRLDIDAYFSYATSVAKRMYRFLDKRFWVKPRWEFDLKEFAFHRIGLSNKYNIAQIKNKLQPAIDELTTSTPERAAFLEAMEPDKRYVKVGKGSWLIVLARKPLSPSLPNHAPVEPSGLVAELVNRGVTYEVACELVAENPPELVSIRIEVFDWLAVQPKQRVIKESPIGYLIDSIRNRYLTTPKGFVSDAEAKRRREQQEGQQRRETEERTQKNREQVRQKAEHKAVKEYWEALTPEQQEALEHEAGCPSLTGLKKEPLARLQRTFLRNAHIRKVLGLPPEDGSEE